MNSQKKKVVILGAGPAGIEAAHRFQSDGYDVTIVERREQAGGLGSTFRWQDFHLDFGPHAFHPKPSVVMEHIEEIFKDEKDALIFQNRNERLLLKNKHFQYPLKLWELVWRLNPFYTLKLGFDFIMASLIYRYIAVPDDNFESWGIKRFGKTLYSLCFGRYTEKVWGIPPAKISPKFARQKIHKLSLKDIIKKLLGGRGEEQENYWQDLFYPRLGSGQLFDKYQKFLEKKGVKFLFQSEPTHFVVEEGRVKAIDISLHGNQKRIETDLVISTIPIGILVKILKDHISDYAKYKSGLLKFRSVVLVYIEFLQDNASGVHWVYLLDPKYRSNRFTEQKNMSVATCPRDRTVLCFERSCNFMDEVWNYSDEEIFKKVVQEDIVTNPHLDATKVGRYHIVRLRHAYPIYDLGFERNLRVVLDSLARFCNLFTIGRQGLFLQNDMHGSMIMGWEVGNFAASGESPWLWYQSILKRWDMD